MHFVVTVPRRLLVCVLGVMKESRPLRKHPWALCMSAHMEEGGGCGFILHCGGVNG